MAHDNTPEQENVVIAYEPDRQIRKLIGETTNLDDIFTPERIAACQKTINDSRDSFFETTEGDLRDLEKVFARHQGAEATDDTWFEDIAMCANNMRGHAELFGFGLMATICNHIMTCCESSERTVITRYLLIRDLARLLRVAVKEKITDEGGALGRELLETLRRF